MTDPILMSTTNNKQQQQYFKGLIKFDEVAMSFELNLIDVQHSLKKMQQQQQVNEKKQTTLSADANRHHADGSEHREESTECKFIRLSSMLRIALANGFLEIECESSDLLVDLVQSLVIDRLGLELSAQSHQSGEFSSDVAPILRELDHINVQSRQLEESEKRIQSEMYESAEYTKNLMQQFAIANELNEL